MRQLGGCRSGEMRIRRWLHNPAVTPEEIFETAAARTAGATAGRHVLVIQDTTSIHASDRDRRHHKGRGLALHAAICVDADDGALLGVAHGTLLERPTGRKHARRSRSYEEKESFRWQAGCERAVALAPTARQITLVADRESDIYDLFAFRPAACGMVIRAAQDRLLVDGGKLFATTDALPETGRTTVDRPAAPGRRARPMTLGIHVGKVALDRPANRRGRKWRHLPEQIDLTVVDVREIDPPAGEVPARWRLLTTHRVKTLADAKRVVALYRRRWAIEQVFRTMKTKGFDIEAVRMAEDAPRKVLAAAVLVAAVTIQQLVHARDGTTDRPLEDALDPDDVEALEALCAELEGRTEKQKNPHPRGSLAYAAWVMGRLGGWNCYYGNPGPITMVRGWRQFQAIRHGWTLATGHDV
jgi:hypothetical protein